MEQPTLKTPAREPDRLERRAIPAMPRTNFALRSIPAWGVSLVLHACLLTAVALFWVAQPNGTGGQADRPVGVAVVYEANSGEEYYVGESSSGGSPNDASAEGVTSALPAPGELDVDQDLIDSLFQGDVSAGANAGEAVGDLGLGQGDTQLGQNLEVPKVKTTVFGIEGEGTRFLYVFDRSDSMNGYGGAPFLAAKSQLLESLESLGIAHQFQIIFYNDTPLPFGGLGGGGPRILTGSEQDKNSAKRFVKNVIADGGTQHVEALQMAINMAPDVVFFLTDADTAPSKRELDRILVKASRVGATIHTIAFGRGSNQLGGGWIQFLAESSGGQYRYIDVTQLGQLDSDKP